MSVQNTVETTSKYPSQEELCEYLVAKLRNYKYINITTRPIQNARGTCYGIDIKNDTLSNLGNGVFHSLSMRTVSHTSRIINIKLVFNDNEERNADMKINADAIIQIYREIANTTKPNGELNKTLENIRFEEFTDNRDNSHLAIIAESTKGASLVYAYRRTMDFIRIINEKYSTDSTENTNKDLEDDDMTIDEIDAKSKLLEKQLKALTELRNVQHDTSGSASASASDSAITTSNSTTTNKSKPKKLTISVGNKIISKNKK